MVFLLDLARALAEVSGVSLGARICSWKLQVPDKGGHRSTREHEAESLIFAATQLKRDKVTRGCFLHEFSEGELELSAFYLGLHGWLERFDRNYSLAPAGRRAQ
jgi:hypothetical protein